MRVRAVRNLVLLLALAAGSPLAAEAPVSLKSLERQLADLEAANPGNVGIAALDLTTGQRVSIRGNEPFPMASTVKVAIAALYLRQVEFKRRSLDQVMAGSTARSHMRRMLVHSDNYSTDVLLNNLGGPDAVEAWLEQEGIRGMRVDRTIAQLLAAKRDLRDVRDSSTPNAMVDLLKKLDRGTMLTPASRNYLFDLMAECATGRNRLRAGLPSGVRIEHKTGTLNGLADDVGIITMPDGHRVAVAVFARHGTDRPRTIASAARLIYANFVSYVRRPFEVNRDPLAPLDAAAGAQTATLAAITAGATN